jgi:NAD(P)H-hydrate epimerase
VIPLFTRDEVRAIDVHAIEQLGIAGLELMEHAGRGAFDAIEARFGVPPGVTVVGGPGHNGGDGWVVARHLAERGARPRCVLVGDPARLRGDAAPNWARLVELDVQHVAVGEGDLAALDEALSDAPLVIDALFGTGLDRPIGGVHAEVIARINRCEALVAALDLPSGVDANTGQVLGRAVNAALTTTFAAHKRGLHQYPAVTLAGEVVCVPIGAPVPSTSSVALLDDADVVAWVPARAGDVHKGSAGHVLVVAGSPGRTGAAVLAGLGALRTGAGLATLMPRAGARASLDGKVVELMTADMPADLDGAVAAVQSMAEGKQAVVIGPGIGVDAAGAALCVRLALELTQPTVLDADALTALGTDVGRLRDAAGPRVLTPHPGEASRLLGKSTAEVQADRYAAAALLAHRSGQVVVLKGARTIVASGGMARVCPRGAPAMATAGSGDVLAGALGALCCGLAPFEAASAGVYLHGVAGELAARADRGLLASELATALPEAIDQLQRP